MQNFIVFLRIKDLHQWIPQPGLLSRLQMLMIWIQSLNTKSTMQFYWSIQELIWFVYIPHLLNLELDLWTSIKLQGLNKFLIQIYELQGRTVRQLVMVHPNDLRAYDGDRGLNTTLNYSLVEGHSSKYFSINSSTAELYLIKHLDLEILKDPTLILHVRAQQVIFTWYNYFCSCSTFIMLIYCGIHYKI